LVEIGDRAIKIRFAEPGAPAVMVGGSAIGVSPKRLVEIAYGAVEITASNTVLPNMAGMPPPCY
jgi:hypothetical protein